MAIMPRLDLVKTATGVPAALAELASGRMILLRDDSEHGGEGDLLLAAEFASAEAINFMVKEARGVIFLALTAERCAALGLEPISPRGHSHLGDASMVSIEARTGVSTGISAADRARTIQVAVDPAAGGEDLVQPGHVFPLRERAGGVLAHPARVEAAVSLARLAGVRPAAVLCQLMRDDGHMARDEDLERFAARQRLTIVSVSEVVDDTDAAESDRVAAVARTGREMREVMGHFATGVSVVTARSAAGAAVGTTANAISSVSLNPPLLLACLAKGSETLAAIHAGGRFAVNVLADHQRHHSDRFAAKGEAARPHEVRFEEHPLGVPILPEALATITCDVEAIHAAGDHEIVVGNARALSRAERATARPLLFYRGAYSRLTPEEDELVA